ncbi:MAG TPA: sugar transferase [Gemmatimonadales bacterium]|jgi:lipopolysaccharide/colanic/teichoic acid biosynthesis glycosyltransferase
MYRTSTIHEWTVPVFVKAGPVAASRVKRFLDVLLAATLLLLLAPLLAVIALAIKLTSQGPVLFVQERIGYRTSVFPMLKFRTMYAGAERAEAELAAQYGDRTFLKIENDPRTTPLGRWLRLTSVDELPQLINVLRGDMSIVGPRPILKCDLAKFPRGHQVRRFAAKPGITGLWQVSGRSLCSDQERIQLDLVYVDCWSLWLDCLILARTGPVVLAGQGAY